MGLVATKSVFRGLQTTKAQTSAFVIRLLESFISKLASREISIFWLVSVAEDTGLSLAILEPTEDRFCDDGHQRITKAHLKPMAQVS